MTPYIKVHLSFPVAVLACVGLLALALISGCELEGIESDEVNYITIHGTGPDGNPLGYARDGIPMVDSTVTFRVLVGDTVNLRSGRGIPARSDDVTVQWMVSSGTLSPSTSTIGELGISETQWTLGKEAGQQTITAVLVGGDVEGSTSTQLDVAPGPPVEIVLNSERLDILKGGNATLRLLELRDRYGNSWDLNSFTFTLVSSDTTVVLVTNEHVSEVAAVQAVGEGEANLTFAAIGRIYNQFDFRTLSAEASVPVFVDAFPGFSAAFRLVSAGGEFACGVAEGGTGADEGAIYCWGANGANQLGLTSYSGTSLSAARPNMMVQGLPAGLAVTGMTSGQRHSCAILEDASVYCWGANDARQLGSREGGPGAHRTLLDDTAAPSAGEVGYRDIVAGAAHTCALGESGSVYCWGANDRGQVGNGRTRTSELLPQRVEGLENVEVILLASVGPNASHSCAVAAQGALYCWGANEFGQIGDGTQSTRLEATRVQGSISFTSAGTSADPFGRRAYTCAVSEDGSLYCWGDRPAGPGAIPQPTSVSSGGAGRLEDISTGPSHACALAENGDAYCFGSAEYGRLGNDVDNNSTSFDVPQLVSGNRRFSSIALGTSFTITLTESGESFSWGGNHQGQLGTIADSPASAVPVQVVFRTQPAG